MAYILTSKPGFAAVLRDPNALPVSFGMSGWSPKYAAVQTVSVDGAENYQMAPTLRNFIYFYVFGSMPSDILVRGVCMPGDCSSISSGEQGLSYAMSYYSNFNITTTGTPIYVQVARYVFVAFLVHGRFTMMEPESNTGQFEFNLKLVR